jgi:hypothetical protein
VFAGQKFGIKEVDDGVWLASFMHYGLGYFDLEQKTLQPLDNPVRHPCLRYVVLPICPGHKSEVAERVGFEPTVRFPAHTLSKRAP